MPRVKKVGTYEAVWAADDEYIINDRTGKQGKPMAGKIRIERIDKPNRWYVEPDDFHDSGWEVEDPAEAGYFEQDEPPGAIGV